MKWGRGGFSAVDGVVFDQWSAFNDRGSCGEVKNIVQVFRNMCQLGRFVPSALLDGVGRIQEDPSAYFRYIVHFAKLFLEIGLLTALGVFEGLRALEIAFCGRAANSARTFPVGGDPSLSKWRVKSGG